MFGRLAVFLVLFFVTLPVEAASRFWVPLTVTGAVSGTGGLCRLTVNDTTNLSAGIAVIVAGIVGATACDGTTTVTTVVDATHVEVNLAFGLAYTSGGTVAGGNWTATGTGNWAATTGGAGGQSVPGSADTVTFDGSSGGGTVTLNFGGAITIQSLTMGAFTGTWDNSVNNNNITVTSGGTAFTMSGSGVRTINLGGATYTLSSNSSVTFSAATKTNLTLSAGSSTISFTGTGDKNFNSNSLTWGTVSFGAPASSSSASVIQLLGSSIITMATLSITAPNYLVIQAGITPTVTNAVNWVGTATSPIGIASTVAGSINLMDLASGSVCQWCTIRDLNISNAGRFTANNSLGVGGVGSNVTINPPQIGGGGIIGGWLLQRDLDHSNDNTPAFAIGSVA